MSAPTAAAATAPSLARTAPVPGRTRTGPVVVVTPPPTPNGGLHVGHVAGPYLRADLLVRLRRAHGDRAVAHLTHVDSYQSYVAKKARETGTTPAELLRESTRRLHADWAAFGLDPDVVGDNTDPAYLAFLDRCLDHARAVLDLRPATVGRCGGCAQVQVEAYARGTCAHCLHDAYLNVCENCSQPQLGAAMDPRCTACGRAADDTATVTVLHVSDADVAAAAAVMAGRDGGSRRAASLFAGLGEHPLLWEYPSDYGCHHGLDGLAVNPWVEIFFHHLWTVAGHLGIDRDQPWPVLAAELEAAAPRLVYLFGVDNTYYYAFAFTHLALALGVPAMVPEQVKINQFMLLEGHKVSTSRGNVIWALDYAATGEQALLRSRLAGTCPEFAPREFAPAAEGLRTGTPSVADPGVADLAAEHGVDESGEADPPALAVLRRRVRDLAEPAAFSVEQLLNAVAKGRERARALRAAGDDGARQADAVEAYLDHLLAELRLG